MRSLAKVPSGEMVEYDVTLSGLVSNRRIVTLDDLVHEEANPLNFLLDLGKRSVAKFTGWKGSEPPATK